jgi:phage terminase small subunit
MAQIKKLDRSDKDLTPKQRMFCDILVANWGEITYAEACKQAKYECANEKDYSAIASRLLNRRLNPHIAKYIDKKYEEEVNKFKKDKLKRFKRLDHLSKQAEKNKQFNVSVQAEFRSGQLAGLYVDKREVKVSGLEGMTRLELEKKLKELSKKIDGYNAKTIELEAEEIPKITKS